MFVGEVAKYPRALIFVSFVKFSVDVIFYLIWSHKHEIAIHAVWILLD